MKEESKKTELTTIQISKEFAKFLESKGSKFETYEMILKKLINK